MPPQQALAAILRRDEYYNTLTSDGDVPVVARVGPNVSKDGHRLSKWIPHDYNALRVSKGGDEERERGGAGQTSNASSFSIWPRFYPRSIAPARAVSFPSGGPCISRLGIFLAPRTRDKPCLAQLRPEQDCPRLLELLLAPGPPSSPASAPVTKRPAANVPEREFINLVNPEAQPQPKQYNGLISRACPEKLVNLLQEYIYTQ